MDWKTTYNIIALSLLAVLCLLFLISSSFRKKTYEWSKKWYRLFGVKVEYTNRSEKLGIVGAVVMLIFCLILLLLYFFYLR